MKTDTAGHRRGLEAFWGHRICEVDHHNPIKQAHPEWIVTTWHDEGMWKLAVPEVRAFKTAELRRLAERYDFDGFPIDFDRHIPVPPVEVFSGVAVHPSDPGDSLEVRYQGETVNT